MVQIVVFFTAFLGFWPESVLAEDRYCFDILQTAPYIDKDLLSALKKLKVRDRETVHVPELIPVIRKVQALSAQLRHAGYEKVVAAIDTLIDRNQLSYHRMWLMTFLHLALREPRFSSLYPSIIADQSLFEVTTRSSYLKFKRLMRGGSRYDVFLFGELFRLQKAIHLPIVDSADRSESQVALFEPGQFAVLFDPSVFPVGISRENLNSYDWVEDRSAFLMAAHDISHGILVQGGLPAMIKSTPEIGFRPRDLVRAHHLILKGIHHAPPEMNRSSLLQGYEYILHEWPSTAQTMLISVASGPRQALLEQSMNGTERTLAEELGCEDGAKYLCFNRPMKDFIAPEENSWGRLSVKNWLIDLAWSHRPDYRSAQTEFDEIRSAVNAYLEAHPGAVVRYGVSDGSLYEYTREDLNRANLGVLSRELSRVRRSLNELNEPRGGSGGFKGP